MFLQTTSVLSAYPARAMARSYRLICACPARAMAGSYRLIVNEVKKL